ncbi:MAG: rod shape-determining protein MreD [Endomicrobium sp.]|nr:rod shape-determining protein MreD [Endomicrobium sp.]
MINKIFRVILYFCIYIVFCILQFFLHKYTNYFYVLPNLMFLFTIYSGFKKNVFAQIIGFLFGVTFDVFLSNVFGVNTIVFAIIGYLSYKLSNFFDKDIIFAQIFIVLVFSIIYLICILLIYYIIHENYNFNIYNIIGMITTIISTPIVFYFFKHL